MDTVGLRKQLEDHKDFLIWLRKCLDEAKDGIVRIKTKAVRMELGIEDSDIDAYYGLRAVLFDDDVVVERSECMSGDMVLIFMKRRDFDHKPESRDEEIARNSSLYKELDEDVAGLSEIAKMEDFNGFDSGKVVGIIREHKDDIARVRSAGDDEIGVYLKENLGDKKVVDIMIALFGLEADEISSENDEISLWWD